SNLDNGSNLKFETDYRQVYATMMTDWFGVPSTVADQVFGKSFETLDLVTKIVTTSNDDTPSLPSEFVLRQNYPNPFNPSTQISYTLPRADRVKLYVVDVNGRLVRTLVDTDQSAGSYEINFDGMGLASGVYLYTLETSTFRKSMKMTLMK